MNEKMLSDDVSAALNSYSFSPEKFCTEFSKEHRTLQQSFTRLCVAWIKTCASPDYKYDDRNEASHELGVKISAQTDGFMDISLPFI